MHWAMKDTIRLLAGLMMLGLVSASPLGLLLWSGPRMYPAPENSWITLAYLFLLGGGFGISAILLMRRVHLGYCVWAQAVLSFMIFIAYYGFLRREDSFRRYPDPEALERIAPAASWSGVLLLALSAIALGWLPLALKVLLRRLRRDQNSSTDSPRDERV